MKNTMAVLVLWVGIILGGLAEVSAFASGDEELNQKLKQKISADPITKAWAHKIPDFYFSDDNTNLVFMSDSLVEDLRFQPAAPFSSLSVDVLERRSSLALDLLDRMADAIPFEGISQKQANDLMEEASLDPVVGIKALETYDPIINGMRAHGFCFGRADFIYFKLRQAGVPKAAMRKLFQVGLIHGDPSFGKPWSNHIVTLVKAKGGGWWVIDPLYKMVARPSDWVAKNNSVTKGQRTLIFLGNVERVNAQGGIHSYAGLHDTSYPVSRYRVTTNGTTVEQVFQPKLVGQYIKYYDDMFKELVDANRTASHPMDLCAEVGWGCLE